MKKLLLLLLLAGMCSAQTTVAPFLNSEIQLLDNSGLVCSGCLLDTFAAGTTTPLATYSESTGTSLNANPIVLNSAGRATVYLTSASYKFRLRSAAGVTLWTQDNISWVSPLSTFTGISDAGNLTQTQPTAATGGANQSSFSDCMNGTYWTGSVSATDSWCLQDILGTGTNPTSTFTLTHSGSSGAATFSVPGSVSIATLGVTGKATETNWNSVRVVDGTTLTTIQACINAITTGTCQMPPGYTESLSANVVLKKNVVLQFLGPCTITQNSFIVSIPQGADDVTIFSPFAHSSDQGGNAQGCTFQGYTGAAAAIDIGSSAGFTFNTLIRGIHVNLAAAQANAIGIRRTNGVAGPLEYAEVVGGAVSGQIGFQFVGTGALFDGTSDLIGLECNYSASSTNGKCIQFTGVNQNGYSIVGGHSNTGGSANGSVCIDAATGSSKIDLGGFYCDVAATAITVESVANTSVRGWLIVDSGVTLVANFGAGSNGNRIETNTRSIGTQLVTDSGTAATNSVTNGFDMQWNSRRWRVMSEAGATGFEIVDQSDNAQAIAKSVGGATHIDSSAGNPVRTNQNSGAGVEFWNSGASVLTIDAAGTMHPGVAGAVGLGTTALPFSNVFMGTAATNNFKLQPAATSQAITVSVPDPGKSAVNLPLAIAIGTASMTTAGITTGACGTTVTVAATGVLTTDTISFARNAAATIGNGGGLTLNAWPTAGNVNFNYCNSAAGTITPTAMTINWSVVR